MRILEIGKDKASPGRLRLLMVLCVLWALPVLVNAEEGVGKAIFVIGEVTLVPASGQPVVLKKGHILNEGDRIDTSDNGQVQIRMIDGAFVAVRPSSSFLVKRYRMDKDPQKSESQFELIKGGFRAITGKIGKSNKKAYKAVTPVGTIGIRGTDYVAMYCNQDCDSRGIGGTADSVADGLYVGVISGGIHVDNEVATIDVDRNQYAYIESSVGEPQYLDSMPAFLMFQTEPAEDRNLVREKKPDAEPSADAAEQQDSGLALSADGSLDDVVYDPYLAYLDQGGMTQQVFANRNNFVYTIGGNTAVSNQTVDAGGILVRVADLGGQTGVTGLAGPGTAKEYDLGYDPASGLTWGRWAGGSVVTYDPATGDTGTADLGSDSLHWIASGNPGELVVLPTTGVANYVLIGNTSPTDNLGNVGNAAGVTGSLVADFSTMTMDAQLTVGINNQVWTGTGTGLAINSADATFGGGLTVDVSDNVTLNTAVGSGTMSGAFSNNSTTGGAPGNAATSYTMSSNINGTATTVSGAGAFALAP